jgi:hypothetical protein
MSFKQRKEGIMNLYTVREASELYFNKNVSVSHIYNLIRSKSLNCIYIGHKILIPEEALENYCKANFNIKQENL